MTEKNSIVEEAIIQMKNLEELVAENAKGILASTMRQEIKDLVKESLNEADEDEEEVEDEMEFDSDVADVEFGSDEEDEEYEGMDGEDEMEDDEDVIDLTNEPMSTVMKVFKKIGPDDEIEVQKDSDGNIHLIDHENDNEYMIMSESEMDEYFGEMDEEEDELSREDQEDILGDLLPMDEESYYGDMEEEMDIDFEEDETIYEIEMDEAEVDFEDMDDEETIYEIEMDSEEEEDEFYSDAEMFEGMDDEDFMMESKKTMKPKGNVGKGPKFDYGKVMDFPTKKMTKGDEAPYVGKGPKYEFDKKSPSLKGEFGETKHMMKSHSKMEKKEGMMKTPKKMETKEASRTLGSGSNFRKGGLPKPKAHSAFNMNIKESVNPKELEILREKNEEYRKALNVFRNKLNEVAVFNSNLAYATRLFTEHSTSKQEKINILKRFDGVETIKESKNLYKSIKDELTNSKGQQVNESIERVIEKTPSTGSAINLIESKTYENPQFMRMKDLMSKLK